MTGDAAPGGTTVAAFAATLAEGRRDDVALRHKQDGAWPEVTYGDLHDRIDAIARGFLALGLDHGDRVSILAETRPEWTTVSLAVTAAGLVVVPIYPSNSPEECAWVLGDAASRVVVVENAQQAAKVRQIRDGLAQLEHVVVIDGEVGDDADLTLADVISRGASTSPDELRRRVEAVTPDDDYTIIYTSGTTGPPKGCVLSQGNYRAMLEIVREAGLIESEDVVYLFLPLAHAMALLIQLSALDRGVTVAYFGGDTTQIIPELSEVRPTMLPSVPRIFEKIYGMVTSAVDAQTLARAVEVGGQVEDLRLAGQDVPEDLQRAYDAFDEKLFSNVRNAFGGRVRRAVSGAAPIAAEVLQFFWAAGVPVLEGFGMTETSTAATLSTPEHHRWGSVGRALPRVHLRIAEDGELLVRGPNVFGRYHGNPKATAESLVDGWLHTGDLGRIDDDGYLYIIGRKKDIIITAGGKNIAPANLENDLKRSAWISNAVMYADRRPYPVALVSLDPERLAAWAAEKGRSDASASAVREDPEILAAVQEAIDAANASYARVEQVKKFAILDHEMSQETGELTPTSKIKRNVVYEKYADVLDGLYAE
ncbi:long-chain fatty acid--CoA ligase [Patulibacter brassicae]|uniref:Acyl-CoA synthetase n=1 Tax=Patulibacter brassicae TaxID=1705717 RepID=A0ABU4VFT1_9ACTN|nr:long-chain fatty acid--CoA ligase [Patulibacter brassicae]MDX8150687.1 long-chain fatty acid--CoA ligase [Patulibacter brassicae]